MSTSKLKLFNSALLLCGERSLSSLTETVEARRLLDTVWDDDGVRSCLSSAQWKFAMRTVMLDYDPSIEPEFGYRRAFAKPTDWCLTSAVASDEFFQSPLLQYNDESGYWYSDLDVLYVRFISDDAAYGNDLSLWTAKFTEFAAAHFASKIVLKLTGDAKKVEYLGDPRSGLRKRKLDEASSADAMADPPKFIPRGFWSRARRGQRNRDRGNRNSLIG